MVAGALVPAEPLFIGVDISKSWIDIADTQGRKRRVANEPAAITEAFSGPWSHCANLVCEATGGYERALMRVAMQLGLPLRRIYPNRARAFGCACPGLAKTDALDAQMLAEFAAFTVNEPCPALPDPQTQQLADMVRRLTQLGDLRQSECCRVRTAEAENIKASIQAVLAILDAQIIAI